MNSEKNYKKKCNPHQASVEKRPLKDLGSLSHLEKVTTNLVFFDLLVPNPQLISDELNKIGIKGGKPDKRWRFVTHSDISSEDIYFALNSLSGIMKKNYKSN